MHLAVTQTGVAVAALPTRSPHQASSAQPAGIETCAFGQWMMRRWTGVQAADPAATGPGGNAATQLAGQTQERTPNIPLGPSAAQPLVASAAARDAVVATKDRDPVNVTAENATQDGKAQDGNLSIFRLSPTERSEVATDAHGDLIDVADRPEDAESPALTAAPAQALEAAGHARSAVPGNTGTAKKIDGPPVSGGISTLPGVTEQAVAGAAPVVEPQPVPGRMTVRKTSEKAPEAVSGSGKAVGTEKKTAAARAGGAIEAQVSSVAAQVSAVPVAAPGPAAHAASQAAPVAALPAGTPQTAGSVVRINATADASASINPARAAEHRISTTAEEHAAPPVVAGSAAPAPHDASSAAPAGAAPTTAHGVQQNLPAPVAAATPDSAAHATHASLPGAAFDRIDSGTAPHLLSRTPQRLDVGVRDPGLGWVEIRAHAAEGQIAATLSASTAAHPALAAQLPAMREYLANQQVRVDTLNAQPFEASADGRRHAPANQDPGGNAQATLPDSSDEAEPESASWIDVRV